MRILFREISNLDTLTDYIIEIDNGISFDINNNLVKFLTKKDSDFGQIVRIYKVHDAKLLAEKMAKEGYIDLTGCELKDEFQNVPAIQTYYLIKNGEESKKPMDYEDEDEKGIDEHIEKLERQIKEWKELKNRKFNK